MSFDCSPDFDSSGIDRRTPPIKSEIEQHGKEQVSFRFEI